MIDEKPKVHTPEEVAAKIVATGLEGWYFDPEGGGLRGESAANRWQSSLMAGNAVGYPREASWNHADLPEPRGYGPGQARGPLGGRDHRWRPRPVIQDR